MSENLGLSPLKTNHPNYWTEEDKINAVQTYLKLGKNMLLTSETLGIHRNTLLGWSKQAWWTVLVDELQSEENFQISRKLTQIIQQSLTIVEDRLTNGDIFYNPRTGKIDRKPVSLRDAHAILKDNIYLRVDVENGASRPTDATTIADKLSQLAKQFEAIANKKPVVEVTDIIYKDSPDALHEKRET